MKRPDIFCHHVAELVHSLVDIETALMCGGRGDLPTVGPHVLIEL